MTALSTVASSAFAQATVAELPTDYPRTAARAARAAVEEHSLPGPTSVRLEDLRDRLGVALAPVALAVVVLTLERHTGERDLLVGIGGKAGEVVPVRIGIDPGSTFTSLLSRTAEAVREAVRHGQVPGERGIAMRVVVDPPDRTDNMAPEIDLVVSLCAGTILRLTYNSSLYTAETAVRFLADCAALLSSALCRPLVPVRQLRMRPGPGPTPPWPLPVPDGFSPPDPPTDTETLVDRFRAITAEHPDRVAVRGRSGRYRYSELDRMTTTLARRIGRSAAPDQRLGLLCAHDVGLVVAVWSALKAGYAYVPLDPRQPIDRLARIVADAGVAAIACDPDLVGRASRLARGRRVMPIVGPVEEHMTEWPSPASADTLAYLMYTSGTTGGPKGVRQSHRNVLSHAITYASRIRIQAGDQVPLLAGFAFDAAVMDLFGTILTGATLTIVDPLAPARRLRADLAESGASIVHCTPTLCRHLLSDVDDLAGRLDELATVRTIVLGGEEVTPNDLRAVFRRFPEGCTLVNGLGPTECTIALQHMVTAADLAGHAIPVGHPVEGVGVRLLDVDGRPAEVFGEVEITSEHLALGYWNQPESAASAFDRHPGGMRRYRTGDLARRRSDGALVFCGRKDRQVKIRGHRVEPAEVEADLRAHPSVAQSAVVVERSVEPRLIGYVTSATGQPAEEQELAGYLGRQLPDYAVPARIVPLDALPLGPTGKLDRARLPPPEEVAAVDDAAWSPVERRVASIWCEILGLSRIGRQATFLASGGDSVRLLAMLSRVRAEFGVKIELMDFLTAPTIATIVAFIEMDQP